ncbi:uncharacterized protein LOC118257622 [Cygnus atratus]|uniref:uncharacterized protein LOC118257622 n=1 Tax=Cygnus atratus TaxID=8868 RepID=UPI0015D5FAEE|nr:uncharacterized protein LOC118257622 [Cygnus atratus]
MRKHFEQHCKAPAAAEAALKKSARFNPAAEAAAKRRGVAGRGCRRVRAARSRSSGAQLEPSKAIFNRSVTETRWDPFIGGREHVIHELGYSSRTLSKLSCKQSAASPQQGAPLSSRSPGSSTLALLSLEKELGRWGRGPKNAPAPGGGRAVRTAPQLASRLCSSPASPQVRLLFPRTTPFSARLRARPLRSVSRNFRTARRQSPADPPRVPREPCAQAALQRPKLSPARPAKQRGSRALGELRHKFQIRKQDEETACRASTHARPDARVLTRSSPRFPRARGSFHRGVSKDAASPVLPGRDSTAGSPVPPWHVATRPGPAPLLFPASPRV